MLTIGQGERLVQDQELAGLTLNQKASQDFPVNTLLNFAVPCRTVVKESKNNKLFLYIYDALKNGSESRIPIGMLIRAPFLAENRKPMQGQNTLQDALLACLDKPNPGYEAWLLVKGRQIKVVRNVTCKDRPFGATTEQDVNFNIFNYA